MNATVKACHVLRSAEDDLGEVIRSLVAAEPAALEHAARLLENMVGALSDIHMSARGEGSAALRQSVTCFQTKLMRAESLSRSALRNLDPVIAAAGLPQAEMGASIGFEA